jgi:Zn-dependent M28 family amino/carboxypeptidase
LPPPELTEAVSAPVDVAALRADVERLSAIERASGSEGEREAAEWLVARLAEHGVDAAIEVEEGHGTYWWPLGLASAAGALAGVAAIRGSRFGAAALAGVAAAAAADDLPPRGKRSLRRLLRRRPLHNVVAEIGPADAEYTVVIGAHHDAAHSGLLFAPAIPELLFRRAFPKLLERSNTSPGLMWPVIGGPAAVLAGAVSGRRALAKLGAVVSAGSALAFADIGSREVVPGANDNATGVAVLLAMARARAERPVERLRVVLVSTSEEALCEGMQLFARRHFPELPRHSTFFLSVDTVGSPHLLVLRGEGMAGMTEYPRESLELLDGLAEELGIELFPNLRLRNATDGVYPLAAGYQCASLCSCTELKQPANYHWPTDTPDRVNYETVADAVRLTDAVVRRLDERWL